jgi:site-specific DNA-methyltransferase (cytosine-N4-specific)
LTFNIALTIAIKRHQRRKKARQVGLDLRTGDALAVLRTIPSDSVNCVVCSPPYFGLRDYGVAGQIGLESTVAEYISKLVEIFREIRRVLADDGTLWIVIGDS